MALIHVPRPPKNAGDSDRPLSSLLKSQMEHLFEAEKRLPHRYRSQIYINAIKTEGEAAEYIRKVTEAIHRAHEDAAAQRARRALRPTGSSIAIAAVADESPVEKQGADGKKSAGAAKQKKS